MAVLRVPSEFGSLEAAQNAANDNDTILLAAGTYEQPWSGITKPLHLKGAGAGSSDTVLTTVLQSGQTANTYALLYVLTTPPAIPVLYVEGIRFTGIGASADSNFLGLGSATGLGSTEIIVNRCAAVFTGGGGGVIRSMVKNQINSVKVRLRNCLLTCTAANAQEGRNIDAGELHLERCELTSAPWNFTLSDKTALDTADYVSIPTTQYGYGYGTDLAPWFMVENTFRYRGTVTVDGIPPGVALPVHLIRRVTGAFVATTTCAAGSGEYAFEIPAEEAQYDHLVISVGTDPTRPLAHWPINPELV